MREKLKSIMNSFIMTIDTNNTSIKTEHGVEVICFSLNSSVESAMVTGSVKFLCNDRIKEKYNAMRTEEEYPIEDFDEFNEQQNLTAMTRDEFGKDAVKMIFTEEPLEIELNILDHNRLHELTKEYESTYCDNCGSQMTVGWYHEDSGIKVCSEECGREQFEEFDDRVNDVEDIMCTSFEEW